MQNNREKEIRGTLYRLWLEDSSLTMSLNAFVRKQCEQWYKRWPLSFSLFVRPDLTPDNEIRGLHSL